MADEQTYHMTQDAYEKLKAELSHKLEVEQPAMAARLKAAIEMGDLSENAEYISAKEDQGFLQGRIEELQRIIRGAEIINENAGARDTVQIGARVTLLEEGMSEAETFQILGKVEASPVDGKISNESPLGKALMGKKVGAKVSIDAPDGKLYFIIKKIE